MAAATWTSIAVGRVDLVRTSGFLSTCAATRVRTALRREPAVLAVSPPPLGEIVRRCDLRPAGRAPGADHRSTSHRDVALAGDRWPRVGRPCREVDAGPEARAGAGRDGSTRPDRSALSTRGHRPDPRGAAALRGPALTETTARLRDTTRGWPRPGPTRQHVVDDSSRTDGLPRPASDPTGMDVMLIRVSSDFEASPVPPDFYDGPQAAMPVRTRPRAADGGPLASGGGRIIAQQMAEIVTRLPRAAGHARCTLRRYRDVEAVARILLPPVAVILAHRPRVASGHRGADVDERRPGRERPVRAPPRWSARGDDLDLWAATFRDPDGHGLALTQWRNLADSGPRHRAIVNGHGPSTVRRT